MLRLTNCHLCDKGIITHNADLYIDETSGKIVSPPPDDSVITSTIDIKGQIVAPGFIDIQNNGIYGLNFSRLNEDSTEKDVADFKLFYRDAMAKLLHTGVTSMCPTVTTSLPLTYKKVLPIYKRTRTSSMTDSLGAHCEGPRISKAKKGCHPPETIDDIVTGKFSDSSLVDIYGGSENLQNVAIVTAAPEVPGVLDSIEPLTKNHVIFSIGHTSADHETCLLAVRKGASMVTHLYNAMPQPHHRDSGVVGLVSTPAAAPYQPYFGIICDGVHVAPSMCVLAYRANPLHCVLTTDAMHLIGLPDGVYSWEGRNIVKKGPRVYLEGTSTLAGSATELPQCVRNLVNWANISLPEAVKTVTNNAADSLNISHKKGYLNPGCDADLVIMDPAGYISSVYKCGRRVASHKEANM